MFIHNNHHKYIKQCTEDLIFHIYKDPGILSYIYNVQDPDKIKRPY